MKQILLIIAFIMVTNSLLACLSATQNRVFPLGKTSIGLCVMETRLFRTEYVRNGYEVVEGTPAWGGISYFKIYDNNHQEVYTEILDTIPLFKQSNYDEVLNKMLDKSLTLARKYSDFISAVPQTITFCDFQKKCSLGMLKLDASKRKISVQLPNNKSYDINALYNANSVAANMISAYAIADDSDLTAEELLDVLYLSSIRQFVIGGKKLTVVHIAAGNTSELAEGGTYPPGVEYKATFNFKEHSNTIFQEPLLHHGHGFDFFIWN